MLLKRALTIMAFSVAGLTTGWAMVLAVFAIVPVQTSAFVIGDAVAGWLDVREPRTRSVEWTTPAAARTLALAVVAAEDQRFPTHSGFDFDAIEQALDRRERGERSGGASTISQQVVKNLFLSSAPTWRRKGVEALLTVMVEIIWSKPRILAAYLSVAEFAPGVYGAAPAAPAVFGREPSALSAAQAARLAAVLPSPRRYSAVRPSAFVQSRSRRIERQMRQLGDDHLATVVDIDGAGPPGTPAR